MNVFRSSFLLIISFCLLFGCKDKYAEMVKEQKRLDEEYITAYLEGAKITNFQRLESGVYYVPEVPGTGAQIQKGNQITVKYIGRYIGSYGGGTFFSTYSNGASATFSVGNTGIRGLDEGFQLMKDKERAMLLIPSGLAYGRNYGNYNIPPNSVLIYELDIQEVK